MAGAPTGPLPGTQSQQPEMSFDHTGQVAPPGMKPRVTATLWEDEGTLCFQVEAKSVCVARREGNYETFHNLYEDDGRPKRFLMILEGLETCNGHGEDNVRVAATHLLGAKHYRRSREVAE